MGDGAKRTLGASPGTPWLLVFDDGDGAGGAAVGRLADLLAQLLARVLVRARRGSRRRGPRTPRGRSPCRRRCWRTRRSRQQSSRDASGSSANQPECTGPPVGYSDTGARCPPVVAERVGRSTKNLPVTDHALRLRPHRSPRTAAPARLIGVAVVGALALVLPRPALRAEPPSPTTILGRLAVLDHVAPSTTSSAPACRPSATCSSSCWRTRATTPPSALRPTTPTWPPPCPPPGPSCTNYYGIGHFSNDNYVALISGQAPNPDNQADCLHYVDFPATATVAADGQISDSGCVFPTSVTTVANQLDPGPPDLEGLHAGHGQHPVPRVRGVRPRRPSGSPDRHRGGRSRGRLRGPPQPLRLLPLDHRRHRHVRRRRGPARHHRRGPPGQHTGRRHRSGHRPPSRWPPPPT